MCDSSAADTYRILGHIFMQPGFDYEGVVRAIYENEGFNPETTPGLSDQLRDLLSAENLPEEKVNEIMGCMAINIAGGRQKTDIIHFLHKGRVRNLRSAQRRRAAPSSKRRSGQRSRHNGASTRRRLK